MGTAKESLRDRIGWWVAYHLPRFVVYFAVIRMFGEVSTGGKFGDVEAGRLTMQDAIEEWQYGTSNRRARRGTDDFVQTA
jgi:hypothetical protein